MRRSSLILTAVLGTAAAAKADISAQWVNVPITATTDSSGADITGDHTWDLQVTVTGGDDWTATRLFANAPAGGAFFQHAFGNNQASAYAPPNAAFFAAFPALQFDSYLSSANGGSPTILGGFDGTNDTAAGTDQFTTSKIGVTYGDLVDTGNGVFNIAQVTFSGPAPTFSGLILSKNVANGIAVPAGIPEPTSIAGVISIGALLARRKR